MKLQIRAAELKDLDQWKQMRTELWPNSRAEHLAEITAYFAGTSIDVVGCLVAATETGELGGFIELNIRNFAEGSRQAEVPYVEGWYVVPAQRGQSLGLELMQQAEVWAKNLGYTELASDTEIDNHKSMALHKNMGFEETDRVVCFLKKLD